MSSVANLNNFNNLLYNTRKRALSDYVEHQVGRVPLDLSFKGYNKTDNVINSYRSQLNGKNGDLKYLPDNENHSRPYLNHDAIYDPTILNSVRKNLVDVSGILIANEKLPKNRGIDRTVRPLKIYGAVL